MTDPSDITAIGTTFAGTGAARSAPRPASVRTGLVLGATGGTGGQTAALARRGWRVRAPARLDSPDSAAASTRRAEHPEREWVSGDALDPAVVGDPASLRGGRPR